MDETQKQNLKNLTILLKKHDGKQLISNEEFNAGLTDIINAFANMRASNKALTEEHKTILNDVLKAISTQFEAITAKADSTLQKAESSSTEAIKSIAGKMKELQDVLDRAYEFTAVDGEDGKDGENGKDGSPDTPEQVKEKLETLQGDKRLDKSAIKGLEKVISNDDLDRAISILDQRSQFLINKGVKHDGTLTGAGTDASPLSVVGGAGTGTVTSVASADGSVTITNPTTTPDLAVVKSPKLTTGRTISTTGDVTYTSPAFDGTGNVTGAATIANSAVTLAKQADVATSTVFYRKTAGVGAPEVNTLATLKTDLGLTGTNTGDQTSIVGITGTMAQFDTAVTDGDFVYQGQALGTPSSGIATNLTGTASGLTAGNVTTNANLTGPVTSVGNATTIANSINLPGSPTTTTQSQNDNSTKVATTAYVDNAVLGQNFKEAVRVATTSALVGIYSNGSSGVGATFTYTATGTDNIDGVNLVLGDRVLVKNQGASDLQNGIYTVTVAGALGIAGVLTRATDTNQSGEFKTGDSVFVTAGTTLSATTWAYTGIDSPTMGTTSLTYVQVAGQGSFTGGNGITITGTSIAIDTTVTVDKNTAQALTNKTLTDSSNAVLTLTTTGSSGAATYSGNTLNIPNYAAGSGITRSVNSVSASTTLGSTTATDYVYLVSGSTVLTFPTAVGNTNLYTIKNVGVGTVTIQTTSGQTIDGSVSITLVPQYASIDCVSDNANWNII